MLTSGMMVVGSVATLTINRSYFLSIEVKHMCVLYRFPQRLDAGFLLDYHPCAPLRNVHVEAPRTLRSGQYFACSLICYSGASILPAATTTDCDLLVRNMDFTCVDLVRRLLRR